MQPAAARDCETQAILGFKNVKYMLKNGDKGNVLEHPAGTFPRHISNAS